MPWMPGYSASKAALTTYLEALRPALKRRGVTITTVYPGFVRTGMTVGTPFRRPVPMMEPDEAARHVVRAVAPSAPRLHVPAVHGPRHGCAPMAPERPLRSDDGPRRAAGADLRVLTGKVDLTMSGPAGLIARETSAVTMLGPVPDVSSWTARARRLRDLWPILSRGRQDPGGDRPPDRHEPDRRRVLRRPELAAVPALGAACSSGSRGLDRTGRGGRSCATCPSGRRARVLEVGIGDGENVRLAAVRLGDLRRGHRPDATGGLPRPLPRDGRDGWSGRRPRTCPSRTRLLTPSSASADSIIIRDHAAALREMRRVARPGRR